MKSSLTLVSALLLGGMFYNGASLAQAQMPDPGWPEESTTLTSTSTVDQLQEAFVTVASKIQPSVVTIYAERMQNGPLRPESTDEDNAQDSVPPDNEEASLGSGMVIDANGHILTNYHVVKDAMTIRVVGNDDIHRRPVAKLIGFDEESDLAVLQVPPSSAYQPVEFGDSSTVRIGEWVIAIGAPFDQAQTVTAGVISAKGRHLTKDNQLSLQDYLQTDASINPGNSGGPLVDLQGRVIGINTAILSPARYSVGIGFAVPSNTIKRLLPLLLEGKHVERGFLGVRYLPLAPGVAEAFGISGGMQIGGLAEEDGKSFGPAFDAGLRRGDIITAVNGQKVSTSEEFRHFVSTLTPGTVIQLEVVRPMKQGLQHRTFEITLGDRNADQSTPATPLPPALNIPAGGMEVQNTRELTAAQRTLLGQPPLSLSDSINHVIITHVRPGAAADDAELQQGQVVEKVNVMRRSVTGEESMGAWVDITEKAQLIKIIQELPPQTKVLLQLRDKQDILLYKILVTAKSSL